MHLKFLARGRGAAKAAAEYLLGTHNAAGKERASVEVLRGDPNQVAAVADGLSFEHRYTSGVIAWSPDDTPTAAQVERVLDAFEKTAWAGLAADRYAWSAVLHRDRGSGVHVHVFAARCDLATGRSLNIAPPGWQKTFDPLRDAFNYEHGWSRPDDPARARASRPSPPRAYRDAAAVRAGLDVEPDPRELIGEQLRERVAGGEIKDRAGVVAALQAFGLEVTRQGRHYVTARRPETGERWRLKGGLYEEDFDRGRFMRQQGAVAADRPRAVGGSDAAQAEALWQEVEATRLRRAEYHQTRYGGAGRGGAARGRAAGGVGDRGVRPAGAEPAGRDAGPESLDDHLRRELGRDAVVVAGDGVAARMRPTPEREAELLATPTGAALLRELGRREERIRASAGSDRPIVEAIEEQSERGVSGDVGIVERAQVIDRAQDLLEEDRAELAREEAALLEDPAGEELLRSARLDVLGNADREAQSLVEREAVIDRAAAAAERKRRQDRVQRLFAAPGGDELLLAALDERKPRWRQQATLPAGGIDLALDNAESSRRQPDPRRHQLVLEAEGAFPGSPAAAWRDAGAGVDRTGATGRYAGSVLDRLADRAHVRSLVADEPARPAPPGLVKRVIEWVRERVGRLFDRLRPSKPAQRPDRAGSAGVEPEPEQAAAARTGAAGADPGSGRQADHGCRGGCPEVGRHPAGLGHYHLRRRVARRQAGDTGGPAGDPRSDQLGNGASPQSLDRGCRIETPLAGREGGGGRPAPSASPRRVAGAVVGAPPDYPKAGTGESWPAGPERARRRPHRAGRRRPGCDARRAGTGCPESRHGAPRQATAAVDASAEPWSGRASRRGTAPGPDPRPGHTARVIAVSARAQASAVEGPGT